MQRVVVYILASVVLLALQTTVARFLSVAGIVPDFLVVWIVYVAIRRGQLAATLTGFLLGICVDLISGPDGMLGLEALAKTLAGFTAGYFFNENKTIQSLGGYVILLAIGAASLVHNVVYFLIFLQGTDIGWWSSLLRYGFPATVYTTCVGLLPMFGFARRYLS